MRTILFPMAALLLLSSCEKVAESLVNKISAPAPTGQTVQYTIRAGQHYCENNTYQAVQADALRFTVKFDSSAVYQTTLAENQYDINKLYGFSDNGKDHHQYSARFGWRWSDGALRLFAYVYNEGRVDSKEVTTVAIGAEVSCAIAVTEGAYLFTANGVSTAMPRKSTGEKAMGYRLYPYFGGDEVAPHEVKIWIRNL